MLLAVRAGEFDVGHMGAAHAWHMRGKGFAGDCQGDLSSSNKTLLSQTDQ
jgi:hypothetical protein